ncbi:helix-turn-helix domain-containing protein [Streptomyces sp. H27-D2]|uniref:helix-turn-helix domain-containing protein n=1 Tax=Streptomyces sp. H27-D2 TaxID=3046304 RepID=UPI002DBA4704|nr:helix-turn-helix domain-containing protein [Streptomyces sp. H27-D2]MEC4016063.1 helix-turn-helix domain-containing protein [Streptomyces sp. H27-D2]
MFDARISKINLSVPEAVSASGIGRTTLFSLIKSGELETIKIGRRRYIPVGALNDYLDQLRAQQNGGAAA